MEITNKNWGRNTVSGFGKSFVRKRFSFVSRIEKAVVFLISVSSFQRGKSRGGGGEDHRRHFSTNIENALVAWCKRRRKEGGREGRGLEFNGLSSDEGEGPR